MAFEQWGMATSRRGLEYLALDDALRNTAELGLGCDESAVVTGNVLEDERVMGPHCAFGLSEHIGGAVGLGGFGDPRSVILSDRVWRQGGATEIAGLVLEYGDGVSAEIITDAEDTVF
jgi:hypothetical protein